MGRRIGAYVIDLVIGIAAFVVAFIGLTTTDESGRDCERVTSGASVQVCADTGDTVRYATGGDAALIYALPVGVWLVNAVLLQGATGASAGKHLTGLRVVNRDGTPHGIAKALGRWFFFIADNQPCGVPIVGLVCALASKGHRRVGDMVMGTFVVAKADAGRPVHVGPGTNGPGGSGGPDAFGAGPPPWGGAATPPPGAPPAPGTPPPPPGTGTSPPPFTPPAPPPGGGFGPPSA